MVCGLVAQVSFEPLTLAVFVFSLGYVAAESYCSVVPIMRQVSTPGHLRASSEEYKDFDWRSRCRT
jgi:hypothetical protein